MPEAEAERTFLAGPGEQEAAGHDATDLCLQETPHLLLTPPLLSSSPLLPRAREKGRRAGLDAVGPLLAGRVFIHVHCFSSRTCMHALPACRVVQEACASRERARHLSLCPRVQQLPVPLRLPPSLQRRGCGGGPWLCRCVGLQGESYERNPVRNMKSLEGVAALGPNAGSLSVKS